MKKSIFLIFAGIIISFNLLAQQEVNLKTTKKSFIVKTVDLYPNLDLSIGYVPKSIYESIKANISINNIILKRFGFYTSLEKGFDSNYLANTIGITTSFHRYVNLWGGIGVFNGNFKIRSTENRETIRKEFGVDIMPYKQTFIKLGWSLEVGTTISAGIKIPLDNRHRRVEK